MNKDLLFQLYKIYSPSGCEKKMRKFVKRYIRKNCGDCNIEQDILGNVFITKGCADSYPCIAAHLDQVQDRHSKDFEVIEGKDVVFGYSPKTHEQQGLGADDKNGIWIALECLREFSFLKVAFFVEEEVGLTGSRRCDLSFFSDCRYVIEPDRRGSSDLITSMSVGAVCSNDFIMALGAEHYGYREERGSITDIGELVERGIGISCLNLSCGYYEAHTDNEFTVLSELQNCLDFVCHIIDTLTEVYPFKYEGYSWRSMMRSVHVPKKFEVDADYYYTYGFYDEDWDMMTNILFCHPTMSFEELIGVGGWTFNFHTQDIDTLREIYDDVCELNGYGKNADDNFWNEDDSAGELSFDDVKLRKVS